MLKPNFCTCGLLFQGTTKDYRDHFMYDCPDGPHQKRINSEIVCIMCGKAESGAKGDVQDGAEGTQSSKTGKLQTLSCGHSCHDECTKINKMFQVECFCCMFRKDRIRKEVQERSQ